MTAAALRAYRARLYAAGIRYILATGLLFYAAAAIATIFGVH